MARQQEFVHVGQVFLFFSIKVLMVLDKCCIYEVKTNLNFQDMKAGIILYALFTIASQQLVLEHRA
jgi:hypothetical protein